MSSSGLRCSVVIPVRNGADLIGIQLAALAEQSVDDFEVIVSDNGSADDTRAAALAWRDRLPHLRVVDSSERAGVSHARNVGAGAAATDKILFCDADDMASPRWVEALSSALNDYDLVGGKLETRVINDDQVRDWTEETAVESLPTTLRYLPYAVGANIGVRRTALESLRGFDTSFVGGHEEVDFAWRLQRSGMTAGFVPDAVIHYRLRNNAIGLMKQRFAYGKSNALLQARYREEPALPPFTVRRQIRTLGSHLMAVADVWHPGRREAWAAGLAWCWGRLLGAVQYQRRRPEPEGIQPVEVGGVEAPSMPRSNT